MDAQSFAYWLNGYVELTQGQAPTAAQWKSICEHLSTVFKKVTPPVSMPNVSPVLPPSFPPAWPNQPWGGPICSVGIRNGDVPTPQFTRPTFPPSTIAQYY